MSALAFGGLIRQLFLLPWLLLVLLHSPLLLGPLLSLVTICVLGLALLHGAHTWLHGCARCAAPMGGGGHVGAFCAGCCTPLPPRVRRAFW